LIVTIDGWRMSKNIVEYFNNISSEDCHSWKLLNNRQQNDDSKWASYLWTSKYGHFFTNCILKVYVQMFFNPDFWLLYNLLYLRRYFGRFLLPLSYPNASNTFKKGCLKAEHKTWFFVWPCSQNFQRVVPGQFE